METDCLTGQHTRSEGRAELGSTQKHGNKLHPPPATSGVGQCAPKGCLNTGTRPLRRPGGQSVTVLSHGSGNRKPWWRTPGLDPRRVRIAVAMSREPTHTSSGLLSQTESRRVWLSRPAETGRHCPAATSHTARRAQAGRHSVRRLGRHSLLGRRRQCACEGAALPHGTLLVLGCDADGGGGAPLSRLRSHSCFAPLCGGILGGRRP